MVVLGIHGWSVDNRELIHDAGAVLIVDGVVRAAVNEERLTRNKNEGRFPLNSIDQVLKMEGIQPSDVDVVALSGLNCKDRAVRTLRYCTDTFIRSRIPLPRRIGGAVRNLILNRKRRLPGELENKKIVFVEHHLSHASSAYYTCPWDEALIVTVDGVGDELCATVSLGADGNIRRLMECNGHHSPGIFYSAITLGLGFKRNRHEVKITGLAAYGDPDVCRNSFNGVVIYRDGEFHSREVPLLFRDLNKNTEFFSNLANSYKREDVAASAQRVIEDVVLGLIGDALVRTKVSNVVLTGGVFANVRLNQKIMETEGVDNVYVHPNMGDGGLAMGAALWAYVQENIKAYVQENKKKTFPRFLETVYLGPEWGDRELERALERSGLNYRHCEDVEQATAEWLVRGKIVGRFSGRMEYGPRALGNRSILASPVDTTINNWLNKRLNRTEFMPFAPSTLEERAGEFYIGWNKDHVASRFMTITYDVTARGRELAPAVVHVDGTARPHVVREVDNPKYYRIIKLFEQETGIPSIVNTSFNMHEEPIVCSPQDVIRAFKDGSVDVLTMNNFVVENLSQ